MPRRTAAWNSLPSRSSRSGAPPWRGVRDLVGDVEDQHEIRREALRRDRAELLDQIHAEAAHHALVGERRRHVAVADDPLAARQRGLDLPRDVLGAVRGHEERFGRRLDRLGAVEQ